MNFDKKDNFFLQFFYSDGIFAWIVNGTVGTFQASIKITQTTKVSHSYNI